MKQKEQKQAENTKKKSTNAKVATQYTNYAGYTTGLEVLA